MLNYPRAGRRCAHRSSGRYLRPNAFAVSTRRSTSPVTFTVSAVAVGMSISRVPQHHMMSDGAGDGRELFRWPWNGRLSFMVSLLSTLRGGPKVTETRYVYQVYWLPEHVLRTVRITSTPEVVMVVETRT